MAMLNIEDYFTRADTVSVVLQFVFALMLVAYIAFVLFFSFFRARQWRDYKFAVLAKRRKSLAKEVWSNMNQKLSNKGSVSQQAIHLFWTKCSDENDTLVKKAQTIDKK